MSEEEIKECLDSLYYQDDVCSISYDKLKDYIIKLKIQLQQKENIIKEVRKKLIKSKEYQAVKSLGLNSKMSILIELEEMLEDKEV